MLDAAKSDILGIGMSGGVIRSARVDATGELVAVKVIPRSMAMARPTLPRPHENILNVRSIMNVGDFSFEIRELAACGELFNMLVEHDSPPTHTLLRWFAQLCAAVAFMHNHQAVHGELRPERVLLSAGFDVKIPAPRFDVLRDFQFTPNLQKPWLAPELATLHGTSAGTKHILKADVYSVGAIGVMLLSGARQAPTEIVLKPQLAELPDD